MKKPWEIIKLLEATGSRLEKESILYQNWRNTEFKNGLRYALDPMVTYGVKQIPEKVGGEPWPELVYHTDHTYVNVTGDTLLVMEDFESAIDNLKTRKITGNNAKDLIAGMIGRCETLDEWNYWYRRILMKDLKCGISEKTVNKMYGKNHIPVFSPMLAKDGTNSQEKYKKECIIDYKFDGVRCLAIIENSECTLYSRTGKVFENFPEINKALGKECYNGIVFDGELMGKDFQMLMKRLNAKKGWAEESMDGYFAIFDVITLEEFRAGISYTTQIDRKKYLDKLMRADVDLFWNPLVHSVNYDILDLGTTLGNDRLLEINGISLQMGMEGLMIKPADGIYECKRSDAWFKIKPFFEYSLEVKAIEEGTGKNKGKLGALVCEGTDTGKLIKVNVGSGLSDDDRYAIWLDPARYIGMIAEVRADAVTQAEDATHYSLRSPRFKGFRGSEPGEKL